MRSFLHELRRRHVFTVAIAYGAVAWLLIQIVSDVAEPLNLPDDFDTIVIVLLAVGFPIALILGWAYDMTPKGIEKTPAVDESDSGSPATTDSSGAPSEVLPAAPDELASVAVIPFRNLTPNSPHGFLADAIPMELENSLTRVPEIRVISGQSGSANGAPQQDLSGIASALRVQYVISGGVEEINDKIRIMAALNGIHGNVLWSNTFDVDADGLLAVQQQIAQSIVSEFSGEKLRADVTNATRVDTENLDAWQLLHRAKAYLLNYNATTVANAIPLIEKALQHDPNYAEGHAALGLIVAERTLNGISSEPDVDRAAAIDSVERAMQLKPADPVILRAAGPVYAYTGDYRKAEELLRSAVAKAPFDLGAWGYLGWPLVASGSKEGFSELHSILDRLLAAAPRHPGSAYWKFHKSVVCSCENNCDGALQFAKQATSEQPRFGLAWLNYANILGRLGRLSEARSAIDQCKSLNPHMTTSFYTELMSTLTDQPEVISSRTIGLHGVDQESS